MMEEASQITSGCNESSPSFGSSAEKQECVNSIQSTEQGPHGVSYEHTTHLHTGETADFVEKELSLVSQHEIDQTYLSTEDSWSFQQHNEDSTTTSSVVDLDLNSYDSLVAQTITTDHELSEIVLTTAAVDNTSSVQELEEPKKEKFDVDKLGYELQVGYKILVNLMGAGNRFVNKLFLHPVDDNFPETSEYYSKIKEPMWMNKMKIKFENLEYTDLTQFMADFRLMIENCYRFNGPDNFVSKKAQKLETMMKQKIALLSKDLRDKLMGSVSTDDDILASAGIRRRIRNPNASAEDESQVLLTQLRRDRALQEKEDRKQRSEDRKALEVARIQEIQSWEDTYVGPIVKANLRSMWELPQIGMFVYLSMECLGLDEEITQYQLERGLVAPRECHDFRRLMTCLLSTQNQRKNVKTFMPYTVWNNKLSQKLDHFYKILYDCGGNHQQACYKLGFDNRAFKVMGKSNPLLKKSFHQLTFLKRVWIIKSYCDYCVESQTYLQKTIEETEAERPMDVREVLLGSDGRGNRYINFPMFTGKDIRIYRYPKLQEPSLTSLGLEDWSMVEEKPSASSSRCSTPVNQRLRFSEPQSTSLRARAILQAAESNDPSPVRDLVRSSPDLQDENSNSNQGTSSVSSETQDPAKNKSGSSYKKRKKSFFTGKRKRQKVGSRREIALDEYADSPGTEKEEDCGDSQRLNVPKFNSEHGDISGDKDCDTNSNGCDSNKKPVESSISSGDTDISSRQPVPNSLSPSSNYAKNITNGIHSSPNENRNNDNSSKDVSELSDSVVTRVNSKDVFELSDSVVTRVNSKLNDKCNEVNHSNGHRGGGEKISQTDVSDEKCFNGTETNAVEEELNTKSDNLNSTDKTDVNSSYKNESSSCVEESDKKVISTVEKKPDVSVDDTLKTESEEKKCNGFHSCDTEEKMKVERTQCVDSDNTKDETESGVKVEQVSGIKEEMEMSAVKEEGEGVEHLEQPGTKMDTDASVKEEEIKEEEEEESDEEDLPDLGHIELIAESMEEIRNLMNKLSNPDPIKRGKRMYPGVMKPCEEELLANLTRFHDELVKYEKSLFNARVHAQVKLRKEVENYSEPKPEENKAWESESSTPSSKESSDDEEVDAKKENPAKPSKKLKSNKSLNDLLSSAANKLRTLKDGDTNEDSNDSYELDISSRGRLRKRRVIPNNTEDTGLKKRKNLNQDVPSTLPSITSSIPSISLPSTDTAPLSTVVNANTKPDSSTILSMLASSSSQSNSTIHNQLASSKGMPCQFVRFLTPNSDDSGSSYKTVRLVNKPNLGISPEKFANVQFITSTGVVTIPTNKLLSSSTQASHPVIQYLLKSQAKTSPNQVSLQSPSTSDVKKKSEQLLSKLLSSNGPGNVVKMTQVANSNQGASGITTAAKTSSFKSTTPAASGAVVVTQVSNSFISQGGKQVLDLGSLSVSQLQQLEKNQAIQINTGAGNPTTLLLTTGLQQRAAVGASPSTSIALTTSGTGSQIKVPGQARVNLNTASGNKNQLGHTTVLPRNSSQLPVIRTIINRPGMNTVSGATVIHPNTPVSHIIGARPHGMLTVVSGSSALKQIPAPRIISSLNQNLFISSQGPNMANKENPPTGGTNNPPLPCSSKATVSGDSPQKPNWVSIPTKKYAGNVTVKALLEHRGSVKKSDNDSGIGHDDVEGCDFQEDPISNGSNETGGTGVAKLEELTNLAVVQGGDGHQKDVKTPSSSSSTAVIPMTQSPSVDAAIQPLLVSSLQVSLPTVNIKVPSPNTLPSMTHDKNSTTIVQSTKVPIPVVSTVDSHSSIAQSSTVNTLSVLDNPVNTSALTVSSIPTKPPVGNIITNPSINVNANNVSNLKNVMLKLTPPKGGSGQFVQGYVTSQGKLVIPQAALLPQQQQQQQTAQVLQAGPKRVILANTSQGLTVQQNQIQAKPQAQITGNNASSQVKLAQQNVINQNQIVHILGQQNNQQIVIANAQPSNANTAARAIPVPSGNPGIKLMLINQSGLPGTQNVPANIGRGGITANVITSQQQAVQTSTPAAELVKQIANSTQLQAAAAQQQMQGTNTTSKPVQMVAHSVQPNMTQMVQQAISGQATRGISPQLVQQAISGQATRGISPQLAAQVLSLQQQGNKIQLQQATGAATAQQVQGGIVLTKPATALQQTQGGQPGAIAVQLQQVNQVLPQTVRGISQVQVPNSQLQQGAQSTLTATAKSIQQTQMVQLAINPQNPNVRTVLTQPASRVVQVAGQLSPQIQLQKQTPLQGMAAPGVPQQVGLIIQQPTLLQSTQQIIRPQASNVVQLQQNNNTVIVQQPQQPQQKQTLQHNAATIQQVKHQSQIMDNTRVRQHLNLPVSGNQAQIQFVVNQSTATNVSNMNCTNVNVARFSKPVMHPVIRAVTASTPTSAVQSVVPIVHSSSSTAHTLLASGAGAGTPKPAAVVQQQVLSQGVAPVSSQFIISPIKLNPQTSQTRLVSPIKLVTPVQTVLQPGSLNDQRTNQLVIQNTAQLHNVNVSVNMNQVNRPVMHTALAGAAPRPTNTVGPVVLNDKSNKISTMLSSSQAGTITNITNLVGIKQPLGSGVLSVQSVQQALPKSTLLTVGGNPGSGLGNTLGGNAVMTAKAVPSVQSGNFIHKLVGQQTVNPIMSQPTANILTAINGDIVTVHKNPQDSFGNKESINILSQQPSPSTGLGQNINNVQVVNQFNGVVVKPSHSQNPAGSGPQISATNGVSDAGMGPSNKQLGNRRNTFGGSQDTPKAIPQRHGSVDEPSTNSSMTLEEMDEKEAALNLLTLANQPL